jgi:WbqC-like protein
MKAAIHQPMYVPYPGFFHKLSLADVLVVMDDVQYDKRFTNRNRILVPQGPMWLTVPIEKEDKFSPNSSVRINNSISWRDDHWKKISLAYRNAAFYDLYAHALEETFQREWGLLFDLDLHLLRLAMGWLGLDLPVVRESELKVGGKASERLINACKAMGADTYVSGRGGRNYMDERLFEKEGVRLVYQEYAPVPYRQRFTSTFVPDLSVIDMLFNLGPDALRVIRGADGEVQSSAGGTASGQALRLI